MFLKEKLYLFGTEFEYILYKLNNIYMTVKRKVFLTILILIFPVILFAEVQEQIRGQKNFWDFLFAEKYLAVVLFAFISLFILWADKFKSRVRVIIMSSAFLVFGILPLLYDSLFITPSPVCSTTKPFLYGLKPQFLATLTVIGVLSLISVKGFCSTACPVGGLQELLYKIPLFNKFKIKFYISNSIRIGLFLLFLVIAFLFGTSTYFYYNLFDLIHWEFIMPIFDYIIFIIFLILILSASIFIFKPFCYLICPMGLLTWILEQFSFLNIRLNKDKCTDCGICETKAPCPSVRSILDNKIIRGDCHLCGECINACSLNALYYGRPGEK